MAGYQSKKQMAQSREDDLVKRLREYCDGNNDLMDAAADRIEQLEEALRPFARVIEEKITGDFNHDHPAWFDAYSPVVGDFKRAYDLVGEKKDD